MDLVLKTFLHKFFFLLDYNTYPMCGVVSESQSHPFFKCNFGNWIWQKVATVPTFLPISYIWMGFATSRLPHALKSFVLLTLLCKIWDARNAKVFRQQDLCPIDVV